MIVKSYGGQNHNFAPNLYAYDPAILFGQNEGDVLAYGDFGCDGSTSVTGHSCLNLGEAGQVMRFDVGQDIAGKTPALSFVSPIGELVVKGEVDGVSVATDNYDDGTNTMLAGQHLIYALEDGFLSMWGDWGWRAEAATVSRTDKTDYAAIKVTR